MRDNINEVYFRGGSKARAPAVYQYDYGQWLTFPDLELPTAYEVHFSASITEASVTVIGGEDGVEIPDGCLQRAGTLNAYIYLHTGDSDGETVYIVKIPVKERPPIGEEEPESVQQGVITQAIAALNAGAARAAAAANSAEQSEQNSAQAALEAQSAADSLLNLSLNMVDGSITPLNATEMAGLSVVEIVGIPPFIEDVTPYAAYGLTRSGWYAFVRIAARNGAQVTAATTVQGAAGSILTLGADHVDVAIRFEVAAVSQKVTVNWGTTQDTIVFKATDLAVQNLDYRTTFYIYDIAQFARWEWKLTEDANFKADQNYYTKNGDVYTLAEVQTVQYNLTADATFQTDKKYYTKNGDVYTEATVTAGEAVTENTYYDASDVPVPADTYYVHAKLIFEGMARNVTYQFNEVVDAPQEYILPEIEDDGHGAWFEIRLRHAGSYSSTLHVPEGVKVATEHTQAETKGFNMVDLHYQSVAGDKIWRFMNTHSSIPAA